jgi:hypothetical protein
MTSILEEACAYYVRCRHKLQLSICLDSVAGSCKVFLVPSFLFNSSRNEAYMTTHEEYICNVI